MEGIQSLEQGQWTRKLTQICSAGSWLIMSVVILGIIGDSEFSYLSYHDLFMFSLSLAIIGFVTGIEAIRNGNLEAGPEQTEMVEPIIILCTVSSGMLILGLCIFLMTADFL